jgi:hypothetical protein
MTSFKESLFVKDNSPGWEWSCIHSTSSTGMFCTKGRAHPTDPLCSPWSFPDRTFIASSQGIIGNGQTLKGLMSGWLHIMPFWGLNESADFTHETFCWTCLDDKRLVGYQHAGWPFAGKVFRRRNVPWLMMIGRCFITTGQKWIWLSTSRVIIGGLKSKSYVIRYN